MGPPSAARLADRSERLLLLTGGVLTAVMLAMSYVPQDSTEPRDVDALAVGLLVLAVGSLVALRRAPMVGLAMALAATAVWFPLGYAGAWPAAALLVAIFVVARDAASKRILLTVLGVLGVSTAAMLAGGVDSFVTAVGILGWMAAAALLGDAVRQRRALVIAHAEQIASVEAEQRAEADRRIAEERLQVARDLHDVLAHTLAAVSLHAGAAADLLDADDPAARHLTLVREVVAGAVTDVRRSIGVLRTGGASDAEAVPGWAALAALVEEAGAAGTTVELELDGVALDALPELVGVCVYRLAQEGITNLRRHSQAAGGVLRVAASSDALLVELEDPGPRRLAQGAPGYGLVGMSERVQAAGGTFDAGPTDSGGYRVSATFLGCLAPA